MAGRVLVAVLLIGVVGLYLGTDAVAARHHTVLLEEFAAMAAPASAPLLVSSGGHKPFSASAGAKYGGAFMYSELRSYYDAELSRHGWQFISEGALLDAGRDRGGRLACYRKMEYSTVLQFAGSPTPYDWSFEIDVTWGSSLCRA